MANTKSAAKRARQTTRITIQNRGALTQVKSNLKKLRTEIAGKSENAKAGFQKVTSLLDRAVKSGRLHRNAANRHKSKLARQLAAKA